MEEKKNKQPNSKPAEKRERNTPPKKARGQIPTYISLSFAG
jgi:hypothetical protein